MTRFIAMTAAALALVAVGCDPVAAADARLTLDHIKQPIAVCKLMWDYPADEEQYIDGYRVYVNGAAVWDKTGADARATGCEHLAIEALGTYTLTLTAFNADEESAPSEPLTIDVVAKTITVSPGAITIQITR